MGYRSKLRRAFARDSKRTENVPTAQMGLTSKFVLVIVALYVGGVAGFLGGYLTNASILRGYREEADDLRIQLYRQWRDVK